MDAIDNLLQAVNNFYHKYGRYPKIFVANDFFDNYADEIAKLSKDGVEIEVKEWFQNNPFNVDKFKTFRVEKVNGGQNIDTLTDLKRIVDELIEQAWDIGRYEPCHPTPKFFYLCI